MAPQRLEVDTPRNQETKKPKNRMHSEQPSHLGVEETAQTLRMQFTGARKKTALSLLLLALLWQVAAFLTPDYVIPGWPLIFEKLVRLRPDWIAATTLRVCFALILSFAIGFGTAVILYFWRSLEDLCMPLVKVVMAVPVICWILFAVLWFRGTEFRVAFVLVIVCAPIFLVDLLDGMKGIPGELRDMVRSLRPTRFQLFRKLILPALLPAVFTGWKVNLSLAIRVVTIAELVGATSGIGYGLVVAQGLFSIADIFAWTLVLVLILLIFQQMVSALESRYLRWREIS